MQGHKARRQLVEMEPLPGVVAGAAEVAKVRAAAALGLGACRAGEAMVELLVIAFNDLH